MSFNTDSRGVPRGGCSVCGCAQYDGGAEGKKCTDCHHPPGKHRNLNTGSVAAPSQAFIPTPQPFIPPPPANVYTLSAHGYVDVQMADLSDPVCQFSGCSKKADFDLNTLEQHPYCVDHINTSMDMSMSTQGAPDPSASISSLSLAGSPPSSQPAPQSSLFSKLSGFFSKSNRPYDSLAPAPETTQPVGTAPQFHPSASLPTFRPPQPVPQPVPVTFAPTIPPDQQCKLKGCTKQRFTEPGGHMHDCCGRRHAREYEKQNCKVPQQLQCKTSGCSRQRYKTDQGTYHDFCSKYCRDNGVQTQAPMLASPSTPNMALTSYGACSLPGCTRPKYCDPANNRVHDFCGRGHAQQGHQQGIATDSVNIRQASQQELSTITGNFQRKWASRKGACPPVAFVYIINNSKLTQRWQTYRSKLQNKAVEQYYHGTKITCNITASAALCNDQDCGVCGISRTGLDRRCIQKNISFQRFGHGFYLAPNSSKCHDYTQGRHTYRAMLLFDVCPGNKYNVKQNDTSLRSPPQGFDSVYGQAGGSLNYEELVVYQPDAALPKCVIVYQRDGESKRAN